VHLRERGLPGHRAVQHLAVGAPQPVLAIEHGEAVQRIGHVTTEEFTKRGESERAVSLDEDPEANQRAQHSPQC
jgi:hypothetical protein